MLGPHLHFHPVVLLTLPVKNKAVTGIIPQENFPILFPHAFASEFTSSGFPFTLTICEIAKVSLALVHQISSHLMCSKTRLSSSPLCDQSHQNSPFCQTGLSAYRHAVISPILKTKANAHWTAYLLSEITISLITIRAKLFERVVHICHFHFLPPKPSPSPLCGNHSWQGRVASIGQELTIISQCSLYPAGRQHVALLITHSSRTDCLHLLSRTSDSPVFSFHLSDCLSVSLAGARSSQHC